MSHYLMLSKYGNCSRLLKIKNKLKIRWFLQIKSRRILVFLWAFLIKTIIPLALVGYEMIIANSYPTRICGINGQMYCTDLWRLWAFEG